MTRGVKRGLLVATALVAVVLTVWLVSQRAGREASQGDRAADAWMALRIDVHAAGPDEPIVVVATAYDRRARQAAIVREATGGKYRGSAADGPAEPRVPAAGWPSRLALTTDAGQPLAFTVVDTAPAPADRVVLRIAAGGALPQAILATLVYDAGEARSNVVTLPPAPAGPLDRLIAIGRQAEVLADASRLIATGAELVAVDAASPWGHYYAGAGHEIRGENSEAIAAFERALARVAAGYELPIGLVARIQRLRP